MIHFGRKISLSLLFTAALSLACDGTDASQLEDHALLASADFAAWADESDADPADVKAICQQSAAYLHLRFRLAEATCGAEPADALLYARLLQSGPLQPGTYAIGLGLGYATVLDSSLESTFSGTITIDSWDDDAVTGAYAFQFKQHGTLEGTFAGPWCGPASCD